MALCVIADSEKLRFVSLQSYLRSVSSGKAEPFILRGRPEPGRRIILYFSGIRFIFSNLVLSNCPKMWIVVFAITDAEGRKKLKEKEEENVIQRIQLEILKIL